MRRRVYRGLVLFRKNNATIWYECHLIHIQEMVFLFFYGARASYGPDSGPPPRTEQVRQTNYTSTTLP